MTKIAGIDISKWQTDIDYSALKSGDILGHKVNFVMIRIGYGTSLDAKFLEHVNGCLQAGLNIGVYLYSIAKNAMQARKEAEWVLTTIKAYNLDGKISYPIAYDIEEDKQSKLGKTICTAMCRAFMDTISAANYQPMLYTNINWIYCHLNYDKLKDYPLWLAAYITESRVRDKYGINNHVMWQHSVAGHRYYDIQKVGTVSGVTGQCDCNWCYEDLAEKIRKEYKNGFKAKITKVKITATKVVAASKVTENCIALCADGYTVKAEVIS